MENIQDIIKTKNKANIEKLEQQNIDIFIFVQIKKTKKEYLSHLKYKIENEYPKGDNSNYILGEYQKDILVKINN